jgi:hypothetical protein
MSGPPPYYPEQGGGGYPPQPQGGYPPYGGGYPPPQQGYPPPQQGYPPPQQGYPPPQQVGNTGSIRYTRKIIIRLLKQCCLSGTGPIKNFQQDPDPDTDPKKKIIPDPSSSGSEMNLKSNLGTLKNNFKISIPFCQ